MLKSSKKSSVVLMPDSTFRVRRCREARILPLGDDLRARRRGSHVEGVGELDMGMTEREEKSSMPKTMKKTTISYHQPWSQSKEFNY